MLTFLAAGWTIEALGFLYAVRQSRNACTSAAKKGWARAAWIALGCVALISTIAGFELASQ